MRHIHNITSAAVGSLIGMTAVMGTAQAADWPAQTITKIVPYAAGGTTDVSVRQLARMAEAELGQPIVVENRPGGSGTNAMRAVASAESDGYTLIATTSSPNGPPPAVISGSRTVQDGTEPQARSASSGSSISVLL